MKTQTETPASVIERMAITLECSTPIGGVDGDWPHISYQCRLIRNGREVWAGPYKLGIGHVRLVDPYKTNTRAFLSVDQKNMLSAMVRRPGAQFQDKKLQASACSALALAQKVSPKITDVVYSLLSDGDACGRTFEDWCAELGYDSDSIRALETFRECEWIGKALSRGFTREELEELREAFLEY